MKKQDIDIANKLGKLPEIKEVAPLPPTNSQYQYRSASIPESINANIPGMLKDKLEREAYINGINITQMLVYILDEYYKDKDFPPRPKPKFKK